MGDQHRSVLNPRAQQQVALAVPALTRSAAPRERHAETLTAGLFLVAALALAVLAYPPAPASARSWCHRRLRRGDARRVRGRRRLHGPDRAGPDPMLYLLPPRSSPCAWSPRTSPASSSTSPSVAATSRGCRSSSARAGSRSAPALVFTLASPGAASWDDGPVVLAAFAAYVVCDAVSSLGVDHFGQGSRCAAVRSSAWVYFVDLSSCRSG